MSFSFYLIIKQNTHPKHPQLITKYTKLTNPQRLTLHSNRNCHCYSTLFVANSYELRLDETTMLELGRCCQNIEGK